MAKINGELKQFFFQSTMAGKIWSLAYLDALEYFDNHIPRWLSDFVKRFSKHKDY